MLTDAKVKEIFDYYGVKTNEKAECATIIINGKDTPITDDIRNDVFSNWNNFVIEFDLDEKNDSHSNIDELEYVSMAA